MIICVFVQEIFSGSGQLPGQSQERKPKMKLYVCVKQVPDTAASVKVVGAAGFDESVKFVVNPYDEYALEEALRIVEREGGEVVAVSVGPERAISSIRSALAMGADRGILVQTEEQFLDSAMTAQALKMAIEQDGGAADMILAGKQSVDSEGMQTHYRLAAALGMPIATEVVSLTLQGDKVVVEREIGGGDREVVELARPCVIGAAKGLNEPRYPKLPDILKAKKKQIRQIDMAERKRASSGAEVVALQALPDRGPARMLDGSVREAVIELVRLLRDEDDVLGG